MYIFILLDLSFILLGLHTTQILFFPILDQFRIRSRTINSTNLSALQIRVQTIIQSKKKIERDARGKGRLSSTEK